MSKLQQSIHRASLKKTMYHTPSNSRSSPHAAKDRLNSSRDCSEPERQMEVAFSEGMRVRKASTPQHGSATTYVNTVEDESSQPERGMRCPHILHNPQLRIKDPSCEKIFFNMKTLRSHIEDIHRFVIKSSLSDSAQQESYEAIWKELFKGYRGVIPPASGLSSDDMRQMQNFRIFEMIERFIWNELGSVKMIERERLEGALDRVRSSNNLLLNPESEGFKWSTDAPAGRAAPTQHQGQCKAEPQHPTNISRGRNFQTTLDTRESVHPEHDRGKQGSDDPMTAERSPSPISSTPNSFDERNFAKIMEKFWELMGRSSDPKYEDDEDTEGQAPPDQLHVNHTGMQSIHILKGPSDAAGGSSQTKSGTGRNGRSRTPSTQDSTTRNPKRGHSRSTSGGKDDEDGRRKRPKKSNTRSESTEKATEKFACPYAKRYPEKRFKKAACYYPGFPSVSRVKEHLYRAHAPVIQCPRCYKRFDEQNGLTAHLRDPARCDQRDDDEQDTQTITFEQERKLRSKSRTDDSEEEKWRQIYRIVFDLDAKSETPNPYNDRSASTFQQFSRYEKYSRDNLPSLVESEIKESMLLGQIDMGEQLTPTLLEIVCKCQEHLFAKFRESESGQPEPPTGPDQFDDCNEMDLSFFNDEVWDFSLEGTGLEGDSFTFNRS